LQQNIIECQIKQYLPKRVTGHRNWKSGKCDL